MIKLSFFVNFQSFQTEFNFEHYMALIMNMKKKWCVYFSNLVIILLPTFIQLSWSLTHRLSFFKRLDTFYAQKTFPFNGEVEIVF